MIPGACKFWGTLGAPRLARCRELAALSKEDAKRISTFEHLEADPWLTGSWLDDAGVEHTGSVGELLRWQRSRYDEARTLIEGLIGDLAASGIASTTRPDHIGPMPGVRVESIELLSNANRWGGIDTRIASPDRFLSWPSMDGWNQPFPSDVPSTMPIPASVRPIYLTPKAFDPREFNADSVRSTLIALGSGLTDYVRSVNANPALFPAFSFGSTYPMEIGGNNPPIDSVVRDLMREHPGDWRDYWVRYLYKGVMPPRASEDPSRSAFYSQGFGNPQWEHSLAYRCRYYSRTGERVGEHYAYHCADAMVDLAELLQVARFTLDLGPSATFYSTVQYHRELYRLSKQRLGIRENVAPASYLAMLRREQEARQRRGLANAAALVTMGKFTLTGDNTVGDVIAAGSVATLAASVGVAGAASVLGASSVASLGIGAAFAAVLVGVAVLVGFLTDEATVIRPDERWPMDNPGSTNNWNSNAHWHYTMGDVIRSRPVIDWRVG